MTEPEPDSVGVLDEAKNEVGRVAARLKLREHWERILICAMVLFAVATAVCIVLLVHFVGRVNELTLANRAQGDQLKAAQVAGHASRLADQARTDAEVRSLACFLVQGVPDSAGQGRAGQFRALYGCPAYTGPGARPVPTPTKTIVLPGATTTETVTVPRPVPGPTVTRTRTKTKTVPAPKPTVCAGRVCITLPVK